MHPLTLALDCARADWLSGDASAWLRYRSVMRQIEALPKVRADRPRSERRTARRPVQRRARAGD